MGTSSFARKVLQAGGTRFTNEIARKTRVEFERESSAEFQLNLSNKVRW